MAEGPLQMRRRNLYKYFSERKWAEAFINGEALFRSLSYFRDYEDNNVREDQNEGTSIYRPEGGLVVTKQTSGTTFTLPGHALESTAKQEEIFVFCLSRSLTDELRYRFKAVTCVEILNVGAFCDRVEMALLPSKATFPGPPDRRRIGQRVAYYRETEAGNPRWALPDMIATSKLNSYAWQDEFRLVFSLTDALGFENVAVCLKQGNARKPRNPAEHHWYSLSVGSLRDICRLHEFQPALSASACCGGRTP
jgi:hypothetical protein